MQRVLVFATESYVPKDTPKELEAEKRRYNAETLVKGPRGFTHMRIECDRQQFDSLLAAGPCYADVDLVVAGQYGKTTVMGFASLKVVGKYQIPAAS